jgi:hypothetical protein
MTAASAIDSARARIATGWRIRYEQNDLTGEWRWYLVRDGQYVAMFHDANAACAAYYARIEKELAA